MSFRLKGVWPFVAAAAFLSVVGIGTALTPSAPSHHVTARITQMYAAGARFPYTVIVATAPNALQAHAILHYDEVYRCRVGYLIDGVQTGISLRVDPETCARPQTSSVSRP